MLLVLSNSGETPELADIVAHARRFGIPLIGVAGRDGVDAAAAGGRGDPAARRRPRPARQGIVPTTSTTMTLALGDALAIALMEHRAFTPDHFRMFHPGGKLGARLLRVRDLMHTDPPLVPDGTPMGEALLAMTQQRLWRGGRDRRAGLCWPGSSPTATCAGIWTGFCRCTAGRGDDAATRAPSAPMHLAAKALALMNDRKITCLSGHRRRTAHADRHPAYP